MSQATAANYGRLVCSVLTQEVAPEQPHTCTIVALSSSAKTLATEVQHVTSCGDLFVHTKLRELMTTLLSGLCGVRRLNSALIEGGIVPRGHVIKWLGDAFHPQDMIFAVVSSVPEDSNLGLPQSASANQNRGVGPIVSAKAPQHLSSTHRMQVAAATPSHAAGVSSKFRFGQLKVLLEALSKLSPQANEVTHSLTVAEVARVLTHSKTAELQRTLDTSILDISIY